MITVAYHIWEITLTSISYYIRRPVEGYVLFPLETVDCDASIINVSVSICLRILWSASWNRLISHNKTEKHLIDLMRSTLERKSCQMKNEKDQNLELTENKGIIASTSDKSAHGLKSVYRHYWRKLERFEKEETASRYL